MKTIKQKLPVIGASLLLLIWLQTNLLYAQGGPVQVKVAVATMEMLSPVALVPGTVTSRADAELSAEVEGRLIMVADVGEKMVAGDTIAIIEDLSLRQMAEASLQTRLEQDQLKEPLYDNQPCKRCQPVVLEPQFWNGGGFRSHTFSATLHP